MTNYKTVIGLEIHAQLKTKSKMFCGCDNNAEGAEPNTLTCPVCMGLPGVLPVANRQAIEWVLKTGLALNSKIAEFSKFDRKHYFYPDLPKGYQISQYDLPFCVGGEVVILSTAKNLDPSAESPINGYSPQDDRKTIHLTRIHLEEDAGKLMHSGADSLVDLNRAGTPLMEIVTEPEIESPAEAKIFMQELRSILRYLDVSDADMEKGHLRCDANISIAVNEKMGTPTEIKNINSFRMLERALSYEEKRQIQEIEAGKTITKETRGWDDAKGETYAQRSKETSQDYRYFPEPDLPPFFCAKAFDIDKLKLEIPELPAGIKERIITVIKNEEGYNPSLHPSWIQQLIDEPILEKQFDYFIRNGIDKLFALAFVSHQMWGKLKTGTTPEQFHKEEILSILKSWWGKKINNTKAKEYFELSLDEPQKVKDILESAIQISDDELKIIVDKVIVENPQVIASIKAGKSEAIGFLVGQVMKETKGQANPSIVNKLIKERLS